MRRIALGFLLCRNSLVSVVALVLVTTSASAQDRGVLAIGVEAGRHAFSFNGEADAVNMCGTVDCEVVATFTACLGVAYSSPTQGQNVWTWLEAPTEGDARVGALNECEAAGGPACEVLNVFCLDAPALEETLNLDRFTRRLIQERLQAGGFDPGGTDGLFGPRTRGAIRRWQAAQGVPATGYMTRLQIEVLEGGDGSLLQTSVNGMRVVDLEVVEADAAEAETNIESSDPASSGFSPDQTCADLTAPESRSFGAACWIEIAEQPGCYGWNANPNRDVDASVTWTAECIGGLAQGTGTLTWKWGEDEEYQRTETGELLDGKQTGYWVERGDGGSQEGPYVDGKRHGHWAFYNGNTRYWEGPYVDGLQHGRWFGRMRDGSPREAFYVNGSLSFR